MSHSRMHLVYAPFSFLRSTTLLPFAVLALTACAPPGQGAALPDDPTHEQATETSASSTSGGLILSAMSSSPEIISAPAPGTMDSVLKKYAHIDPMRLISDKLLKAALGYYDSNLPMVGNKKYLSVVDFSLHSSLPRFFIINMSTGQVLALHVAHGSGSDPKSTGYATKFSNIPNSEQSSLGLYRTAETYTGKHGLSMRLDGLSPTNSKVRAREIVVHGASYVVDANRQAGRSWGCLAVAMNERDKVISLLNSGSLIYAGH